jgi:hypothetical protein
MILFSVMSEDNPSAEDEESLKLIFRAGRDLVSAANGGGADQVALDIQVGENGAGVAVEDDGTGMTPDELERFFEPVGSGEPFYGAEEVQVTTTRNGETLHAYSSDPPEYNLTESEAADRKEGTRVEVRGIGVPANAAEQLDEKTIRERLALDESEWSAIVQIEPPRMEGKELPGSWEAGQLRGATVHDTLENELLNVVEVNADSVVVVPEDEAEERRIPLKGVQGLNGSRYVVKDGVL